MKVWLDDVRAAPPGWERCRWPEDVITLLKTGLVTDLSLDHDLGDDRRGTGYTVLVWLERMVADDGRFPVPVIALHTQNPVARERMAQTLVAIERRRTHIIR